MPLLAGLLGNAFVGVVAWLSSFVSRKLAVGGAFTAFLVAGWISLQAAFASIIGAVTFAMPSSIIPALQIVAYLLPSNFGACINALVLSYVGRWLWDVQREWARAMATV